MKNLMRLLAIVVFSLPFAVFAQTDDISHDDIENAFANLYKNDSLRMVGVIVIEQTITASGLTQEQIIIQQVDGQAQFANSQLIGLNASLDQTISIVGMGQNIEGGMIMEMIFVDDILYIQIPTTSGVLDGQFPGGWINLNEDATSVPGMDLFDIDQLLSTFNTPLMYPLNEETVIAVEAHLIDEDVDVPEGTRAYQVIINAEKAFELGEFATLFAGFEQLGVDMEDLMTQMMVGATIDLVVYIYEGTLIRLEGAFSIDAPLNIMGQSFRLEQVSSSVLNYIDFNEPVEITAPEA